MGYLQAYKPTSMEKQAFLGSLWNGIKQNASNMWNASTNLVTGKGNWRDAASVATGGWVDSSNNASVFSAGSNYRDTLAGKSFFGSPRAETNNGSTSATTKLGDYGRGDNGNPWVRGAIAASGPVGWLSSALYNSFK